MTDFIRRIFSLLENFKGLLATFAYLFEHPRALLEQPAHILENRQLIRKCPIDI